MSDARPVRVQAVIERPAAAPGILVPQPARVDAWDGQLLSWRWLDRDAGAWTGLVRYAREGLMYEHWIHGDLLSVGPDA